MKLKLRLIVVLLGPALLACSLLSGTATPSPLPTLAVLTAPTLVPIAGPTVVPIIVDPIAEQQLYIDLYHRVNPAVVSIRAFSSDGFSQASGFVIDTDGHIATNNHVVEGATELEIDFSSGLKVRGEVLGTDATADLAVIKVEVPADQLTAVSLGDSDLVAVGQRVIAIGNPFGLDGTMTIGIVSGLGRTLDSQVTAPGGGSFSTPKIIQTDAAINPGNSGGPLLNLSGEVIGMNKAIESQTGVNSGVGFSIPSNLIKRVALALIADGKFVYPYLGLGSMDDLTLREIEALSLPRTSGAYVTNVVAGGPADAAGLRAGTQITQIDGLLGGGDLVIAIDRQEVKNFSDLLGYLVTKASVGQTVTLTILRDGQQLDVPVTLGARP